MRAVLVALLLGACVDHAADAPAKHLPAAATGTKFGPTLTFAADDPAALDAPGMPASFQLSTLHHLMIRYRVPQLPPDVTWVTLTLEMPGGGVWTTRHVPFATGHAHPRVASPDGVPHPIDVMLAKSVTGGHALDTSILVGGTNLQRRMLFGRWTVRAMIDGQPDSAASAAFDFVR